MNRAAVTRLSMGSMDNHAPAIRQTGGLLAGYGVHLSGSVAGNQDKFPNHRSVWEMKAFSRAVTKTPYF
jgi:hypothetical protein